MRRREQVVTSAGDRPRTRKKWTVSIVGKKEMMTTLALLLLCTATSHGLVIGVPLSAPERAAYSCRHRPVHMGIRSRLGKVFSRKKDGPNIAVASSRPVVKPPSPPLAMPPPPPPLPQPAPSMPLEYTAKEPPVVKAAAAEPITKEAVVAPATKVNLQSASDRIAPFQEAVTSAFEPLLTLDDRDDGFNDVRQAIKDRQKPWEELKASINKAPAVKWAKVLVDEAQELAASNKK